MCISPFDMQPIAAGSGAAGPHRGWGHPAAAGGAAGERCRTSELWLLQSCKGSNAEFKAPLPQACVGLRHAVNLCLQLTCASLCGASFGQVLSQNPRFRLSLVKDYVTRQLQADNRCGLWLPTAWFVLPLECKQCCALRLGLWSSNSSCCCCCCCCCARPPP